MRKGVEKRERVPRLGLTDLRNQRPILQTLPLPLLSFLSSEFFFFFLMCVLFNSRKFGGFGYYATNS